MTLLGEIDEQIATLRKQADQCRKEGRRDKLERVMSYIGGLELAKMSVRTFRYTMNKLLIEMIDKDNQAGKNALERVLDYVGGNENDKT